MGIKDFEDYFRKKQEAQRNSVAERTTEERRKTKEATEEYDEAKEKLERAIDTFTKEKGCDP